MISRMRARLGPTRLRASWTKLRGTASDGSEGAFRVAVRAAQPGARTDDVEGGAARADVLVRHRSELARVDPCDCCTQLRLELLHLLESEARRDDCLRPLEEVVDDLDLPSSCAEAGERIHEPLEVVIALDDLLGRPLLQ